jgi:hypothetical protein
MWDQFQHFVLIRGLLYRMCLMFVGLTQTLLRVFGLGQNSTDSPNSWGCLYIPKTRQAVYLWRHIEAQACKPCCSWRNKYCVSRVCVCSLSYAARNTRVPYCHLRPAPPYIFPHFLINGTIFEKKLLNTKCVFWFSLQLLSETFLVLRRIERYMIKNVYWSSCRVPAILVWYHVTWIFSTDFRKISN